MPKTFDAYEILYADIANDPEALAMLEHVGIQTDVGMVAYQLRENACFSQEELGARLVQSADWIDDLEMGRFEGDSIEALKSIASALGIDVSAELERMRKSPVSI